MALELKQTIKLSQQLVMTPQLQQAIRLLQLSRQELLEAVEQELVENPMLDVDESTEEEAPQPVEAQAEALAQAEKASSEAAEAAGAEPEPVEPSADEMVSDVDWENYMEAKPQTNLARTDDDRPTLEDNHSPRASLSEHLLWQLGFLELEPIEEKIGIQVVGNLNDSGYLVEGLEGIAETLGADLDRAEKVLLRIQEFDPVGVAARSLAECLLVQAHRAGTDNALALKMIESHLDLLQRRDFRGIARIEGVSVEEVAVAAEIVASFEPRPGRQFSAEDPIYITPDIFVHKIADEYHVVLNEDGLPKLRVSSAYRSVLARNNGEAKETKEYVREKLRSAVWMIKSIHQRQRTIVKVMQSILRFQREFFDKGSEFLKPLNLRDVADDIGMHESTVSRVTTSKYVQTPHGVYELKFFFNSSIQTGDGDSIASESVKEKIRTIIANEDTSKPLSDQRIAGLLKAANIHIARRTVTKYREAMRILSSTRRRQFR
jgi:RNA polymerase sigma-54 factor